jgi:hypothetical protein
VTAKPQRSNLCAQYSGNTRRPARTAEHCPVPQLRAGRDLLVCGCGYSLVFVEDAAEDRLSPYLHYSPRDIEVYLSWSTSSYGSPRGADRVSARPLCLSAGARASTSIAGLAGSAGDPVAESTQDDPPVVYENRAGCGNGWQPWLPSTSSTFVEIVLSEIILGRGVEVTDRTLPLDWLGA